MFNKPLFALILSLSLFSTENLLAMSCRQKFAFSRQSPVKAFSSDFISRFGVRSKTLADFKSKNLYSSDKRIFRGSVERGLLTFDQAIQLLISPKAEVTVGNGVEATSEKIKAAFVSWNKRVENYDETIDFLNAHQKAADENYWNSLLMSWSKDRSIADVYTSPIQMNHFEDSPQTGFSILIESRTPSYGIDREALFDHEGIPNAYAFEKEVTIPVAIDPEMIEKLFLIQFEKLGPENFVIPQKAKALRLKKIELNLYLLEEGYLANSHSATKERDFIVLQTYHVKLVEGGRFTLKKLHE